MNPAATIFKINPEGGLLLPLYHPHRDELSHLFGEAGAFDYADEASLARAEPK